MVGENFELNGLTLHLNYPPWLEKISNFTYLKWPKIAFKLSTMVGENFEFHLSLNGLKLHLNYPPWLDGENFEFYLS